MTNQEKYDQAFMNALQVEQAKLQEQEGWDSVSHMLLVAELEGAFDIMMDTDDIIGLSSYEKGKEILKKYDIDF